MSSVTQRHTQAEAASRYISTSTDPVASAAGTLDTNQSDTMSSVTQRHTQAEAASRYTTTSN